MFSPGFSAYKLLTYNCCFEKFNERRSPKIIENIQMKTNINEKIIYSMKYISIMMAHEITRSIICMTNTIKKISGFGKQNKLSVYSCVCQ